LPTVSKKEAAMNYIFLSPHFPSNYYQFCVHLRNLGATVLGLADEPYDNLRPELKAALSEYYFVPNMHNYDDLLRALGYFTHKYGKLDGLDSMSEYWMETDARLRTDFNIDGLKLADLPAIKHKSLMKRKFAAAGVEAAPGVVIRSASQARSFVKDHGFPVIAKPDIGVGAAKTYRFDSLDQLNAFLDPLPPVEYILEKYITGKIQTFDGLTDHNGDIVFINSLEYSQGIMETVNEDSEIYYYTLRQIPPDLEQAGRSVVKAYKLRKRFFHFEFFRTPENKLVALEVNMRPPGGLTTDMFNFANNINVYYEWANIVLHNKFSSAYARPFHCGYIGRKANRHYLHSHREILSHFGSKIVHSEEISGIFSAALGNFGYLARSPELDEIVEIANFIQAKK
jgi:hypothetical protein